MGGTSTKSSHEQTGCRLVVAEELRQRYKGHYAHANSANLMLDMAVAGEGIKARRPTADSFSESRRRFHKAGPSQTVVIDGGDDVETGKLLGTWVVNSFLSGVDSVRGWREAVGKIPRNLVDHVIIWEFGTITCWR
jgi:hypothetical protein